MLLCSILKIGHRITGRYPTQQRSLSKLSSKVIFSQKDVNMFAELSGDRNPIHVDTSSNIKYGKPIVHGTLMLGRISGMIASAAPGSLFLHMDVTFDNFLHVDEELTLNVSPLLLKRTVLQMQIEGFTAANKSILHGNVDVGLTKTTVRQIRTENPDLLES